MLYVIAIRVVFATLSTIVRTAAYMYALTGEAPGTMEPEMMRVMFCKR